MVTTAFTAAETWLMGEEVPLTVTIRPTVGSQRTQYPLIKAYTLNHKIKAPMI